MSERPNSKRYKVLSLFSGAGGLDITTTVEHKAEVIV